MKTYIIAEIGVNHNGNFDTAKEMIIKFKDAGADIVKFQLWGGDYYNKCEWRNVLDGLSLSYDDFITLKELAYVLNIDFFITAFDQESFDFIKQIDCNIYKIPSNQYVIENKKLMDDIIGSSLKENKRLFISTSKFNFKEIRQLHHRNNNACFFHCVSKYPTPVYESNLNRLSELNEIGCRYYGLSDHSATIEIPVAAVALGAYAIEVHVTLDKNQDGPDHKASLDLKEFKTMVKMIRNVEVAL